MTHHLACGGSGYLADLDCGVDLRVGAGEDGWSELGSTSLLTWDTGRPCLFAMMGAKPRDA